MDNELNDKDMNVLRNMVDRYAVHQILHALARICGDKAEYEAVKLQNTTTAKAWTNCMILVDSVAVKLTEFDVEA